jgi:hypothetical protein
MKRTNKQLQDAIIKICLKYDHGSEEFYSALMRYWVKYNLNQEQCEFVNNVKKYGMDKSGNFLNDVEF